MNSWTLITGASSGIGLELAKLFAADQFNLVLVARDEARLNQLAAELRTRHGIQVKVLARDLSAPSAAQEIFEALTDTPISVLVNNAGFGAYGPFAKADLRTQSDMTRVNMTALVELTHLFLRPMLARGSGRILNVASTAAFQPGPNVNVYYASKAFVYSFSYALSREVESSGVTVTVLCPGTTRTEFFVRAGMRPAGRWPMMDAREVAQTGYRGCLRGKRVVIPGLMNRLGALLAKLAPAWLTTGVVLKIHSRA
jgi:short-subunit dehydrogenase